MKEYYTFIYVYYLEFCLILNPSIHIKTNVFLTEFEVGDGTCLNILLNYMGRGFLASIHKVLELDIFQTISPLSRVIICTLDNGLFLIFVEQYQVSSPLQMYVCPLCSRELHEI